MDNDQREARTAKVIELIAFVSVVMGASFDSYAGDTLENLAVFVSWDDKVVINATQAAPRVLDMEGLTHVQACAIRGYCTINEINCDIS
jgi:hypothetical protein